jgi:hypothetical protein
VIADSNLPDGSKETVVSSADFRSTTRSTPAGTSHEFSGQPVRGEHDVLQVCEVLHEALRRRGVTVVGKFRKPTGRERGIDAAGRTVDGLVLRVQVIGVIRQATMTQLGREGRASSGKNDLQLADEICDAVTRKTARYPATQRNEMVLALDAIRSPGHATRAVVEALRTGRCKNRLQLSGFQSIWLVGPTADRTYQLDK